MNCNSKISCDKNCNIIVQENYNNEYAFVYILQLNDSCGPIH